MSWVHITDWHKYPALWLLNRDTEQPGNTFTLSDYELKILEKHDVPFDILD